ncbi:hypothetical protein ACIBU0_13355 [Streptomyces sp. NPDC049627]|uniref:hypothetical protein n=1 Tax=Streptomyces sp. NPDC049627 TaxID=3365595 RepID=UPI00379981E0
MLHADRDTLVRRIENDSETNARRGDAPSRWRLDHLAAYQDALPWLGREGKVVDTARLSPPQVAQHIADAVSAASA